jgi:hypothetical protein
MREAGKSFGQIAAEIPGKTRGAVSSKWSKLCEGGPQPRFWTAERLETLRKLKSAGRTNSAIASELGCSKSMVSSKLHHLGIFLTRAQRCENAKIRYQQKPAPKPRPTAASRPRPTPKPARTPIVRPDPIVAALLAQARAAERRREGYRAERVR